MAITMLAQFPVGWLPTQVGPGPFPESALEKWWSANLFLLEVMRLCVDEGKGGMLWFGKLERSFSGPIGIFGY